MAEPLRISSVARIYVRSQIKATVNGAAVNPTGDPVKVAFIATGATPQVSDWQTGVWETDSTVTPAVYYAMCLVGPGGTITLAVGLYQMWVQITDNPEIPVLWAGLVRVV